MKKSDKDKAAERGKRERRGKMPKNEGRTSPKTPQKVCGLGVDFGAILNVSPNAVIVHSNQKIIYANKLALDFLKVGAPEGIIGKDIREIIHSSKLDELVPLEEANDKSQSSYREFNTTLSCNDGAVVDVAIVATRLTESVNPPDIWYVRQLHEEEQSTKLGRALRNLGARLNAATTGPQAACEIANEARAIWDLDACIIGIVSSDRKRFRMLYLGDTFNGIYKELEHEDIDDSQPVSPNCEVILKNGSLLIKDRSDLEGIIQTEKFGNTDSQSQSMASVSLSLPGADEIAVLSIHSYKKNNYTEADLESLKLLAEYSSTALARAVAQESLQRNEQGYKQLFDSAPDAIVIHDGKNVLYANAAAALLAGIEKSEKGYHTKLEDILQPETYKIAQERIAHLKKTGEVLPPFVYKVTGKNGRERHIESTSALFQYKNQRSIVTFGRDTTERFRAEKFNRILQELGSRLAGSASSHEAAKNIAWAAMQLLPCEALEFSLLDRRTKLLTCALALDSDEDGVLREFPRVKPKNPSGLFWQIVKEQGLIIDLDSKSINETLERFGKTEKLSKSMMAVPLLDGNDEPLGLIGLHTYRKNSYNEEDLNILKILAAYSVTAVTRTAAQSEMAAREELYRRVIRQIKAVAYHRSLLEKRYLYIDPQIEQLSGYPHEEFSVNPAPNEILSIETLHPHNGMEYEELKRQYHRGDIDSMSTLFEWKAKQGKIKFISDHAISIKDDLGRPVSSLGILQDITEERNIRLSLQRQQAFLESVINMNPGPIWVKDLEGRYVLSNGITAGYIERKAEEIIGLCDDDLVLSEEKRFYIKTTDSQAILEKRDVTLYDRVDVKGENSPRYFKTIKRPLLDPSGNVSHLLGVSTDITAVREIEEERTKLEKQMESALRLEALGMLAGGIAHDFNNLLVGILGNAGLALLRLEENSESREPLKLIEQTAQQASELANRLLIYSGKRKPTPEHFDLYNVIKDVFHLLRVNLKESTKLKLLKETDNCIIEGDPTQIRQIALNLVTNALDATHNNDKGGIVTLSICNAILKKKDFDSIMGSNGMEEGTYLCLEVADNGSGISNKNIGRIFDPFFTTKEKGHGLGLAAVLGSLRSHGGGVMVKSTEGEGTLFRVYLPQSISSPLIDKLKSKEPQFATIRNVIQTKVAIVDDEEIVRDVALAMLQQLGYQCLSFESGQEILEYLGSATPTQLPEAIILDLNMPGMGGLETLRYIREKQQSLPVLISSGYHDDDFTPADEADQYLTFFPKPYRIEELAKVLSDILDK